MALTPPPSAPPAAPTAPGDAPSRANPTTFRALADAFIVWQVGFRNSIASLRNWLADYITWAGTHVSEVSALQVDVAAKASQVTADASSVASDRSAVDAIAASFGDVNGAVTDATTQAGIATTQAGLATTARSGAEAAQTGAVAAKTQAETFAAASATGAKFSDTIALGRASVADGFTFGVLAGGADGLILPTVFRRDGAGSQTKVGVVITESVVKPHRTFFSRLAYALRDAAGNVAAGLDLSGTWLTALTRSERYYAGRSGTSYLRAARMALSGFVWSVCDAAGNIAGGVRADGTLRFRNARVITLDQRMAAGRTFQRYAASPGSSEYLFVPSYGQSNAVGVGGVGTTALTTSQPYGSLMFASGVITGQGVVPDRSSLVPLAEASVETPVAGFANGLNALRDREHDTTIADHAVRIVGSAPGFGGLSISALNKGTTQYSVLMADIAAVASLGSAANKTAGMRGWMWLQGEADGGTGQAAYTTALSQLVNDVDADARAALGQTDAVHCFTWQLTHQANAQNNANVVPGIAYAQASVAQTNPLCHLVCPTYFFDFFDPVHLDNVSKKWFGAYAARSYKRVIEDGLPNPELRATGARRSGNTVVVSFSVPQPPLVFDTSRVAAHTGMGFQLFQADGVTEIAITSVSLLGPSAVKIQASAAVPAGAILRYGRPGTVTKDVRNAGARGNLRDAAGEREVFDDGSNRFPLHNWAFFFQLTVA